MFFAKTPYSSHQGTAQTSSAVYTGWGCCNLEKSPRFLWITSIKLKVDFVSFNKRLCPPKVLLNSNIPFTKPSFDAIYSMKGGFYVGSQRGYADVPVAFPG